MTTVNEVPINELITDGIIDPSKQWQSNPFFVYLQSWFGGASPNVAPADDCPQCSCGKTNPDGRVFGGDETGVNEYPWMAILLYNNEFFCGGSLINDRFVLTAAECVDDKQGTMQNIIVRLLEHDRSMDNETTLIDRQVKSITINPKFNKTSHDSDIALIEFTEPVKFQDNLRPVCLPESDFDYDDSTGNVTGWGGLSDER